MSKNDIYDGYMDCLTNNDTSYSIDGMAYLLIKKNYSFLLKYDKDSEILEFGPGKGYITDFLLINGFKNITLCEIDSKNYETLCKKYGSISGVKIVKDNIISYLNTNNHNYDAIISAQVVEHLSKNDLINFFAIVGKKLKKNGILISETINSQNLIYGNYFRYIDATHYTSFTPKSLRELSRLSFDNINFIDYNILSPIDLLLFLLSDRKKTLNMVDRYNKGIKLDVNLRSNGLKNTDKRILSRLLNYLVNFYYWRKSIRISRRFLKRAPSSTDYFYSPMIIAINLNKH